MQQNTPEWLEARKKKIGASDCPIVLGISPFKTAYELWEEKTGRAKKDDEENFAISKGNAGETVIRRKIELVYQSEFKPVVVSDPDSGFLMASLDGFDGHSVLEIKVPSLEIYLGAKNEGEVPPYYYAQMQQQMFCACVDNGIFAAYNEKLDDVAIVPVQFDRKFWADTLPKLEFFYNCMINDIEPELSSRDFMKIDDVDFAALCEEYCRLTSEIKARNDRLKILKEKIAAEMSHPKHRVLSGDHFFNVVTVNKVGNVDYGKIDELKGVDLDNYRKKGSKYIKVTRKEGAQK